MGLSGGRLSLYQSVFQFSPTSNAVVLVKGDTVSGCKLVLIDRVRHKTCCFSAREREETMCDPSIQSGGCRSLESLKVEEHPGYCKIVFFKIKIEDAAPYLVIFPGKVNDNEEFDIKVSDDSEERIIPGLPPVSDISRFEEVEDFVQGTTATVSVLGNTQSGCKFLFHTCCFSSTSRKDTLCHPDTQSGACRTKERWRDSIFVFYQPAFPPGSGWTSYLTAAFSPCLTLTRMMWDPTRPSFLESFWTI